MNERALPGWLIVVRQDRRELYASLREGFQGDERVEVLLDRRQGDRRTKKPRAQPERRGASRRRSLSAKEAALWESAGFRILHREEDYTIYEAAEGSEGAREALSESKVERHRRVRALLIEAIRLLDDETP